IDQFLLQLRSDRNVVSPGTDPDVAGQRRAFPTRVLLAMGLILVGGAPVPWGYCRATRPVIDLRTSERWVRHERYGPAQQALHDQLRRAAGDGAAWRMLARVLAARGELAGCTRELHQVPAGWPQKARALYREGQAYLLMNRARDAEAALLEAVDAAS